MSLCRRMAQLHYGEWIRASGAKEVECVGVLERNNEWLQRAAEAREAGRRQARLLSRPGSALLKVFESASFLSWLPPRAGSKRVATVLALALRSTQQTLASTGSHVPS